MGVHIRKSRWQSAFRLLLHFVNLLSGPTLAAQQLMVQPYQPTQLPILQPNSLPIHINFLLLNLHLCRNNIPYFFLRLLWHLNSCLPISTPSLLQLAFFHLNSLSVPALIQLSLIKIQMSQIMSPTQFEVLRPAELLFHYNKCPLPLNTHTSRRPQLIASTLPFQQLHAPSRHSNTSHRSQLIPPPISQPSPQASSISQCPSSLSFINWSPYASP